jgi:primosomal protein N'
MTYKTESVAVRNIRELYKKVMQSANILEVEQFSVTPPMPAFHERSSTGYTWQLLLKAKKRQNLISIFDKLPKSPYLHYTFDPISLL